MKKKIFSILLTVTMLVSMLSFFSLSVGAFFEWDYVSPGDSIVLPGYTYYYEVVLTGFTRGQTYYVPLYINQTGHVLIQSFGPSGAYAPAIKVLNADQTEVLLEQGNGFKTQGYGRHQTLLQYFTEGSYILEIKPSTSNNMRLSFTLAENYFNVDPPISTFNDIAEIENGILEGYWTPGTHALIGRFTVEEDTSSVTTSGSPYMEGYILDPRSSTVYDGYSFYGEITQEVDLTAGFEYYVVIFIPDGLLDVPSCMLRLTIS